MTKDNIDDPVEQLAEYERLRAEVARGEKRNASFDDLLAGMRLDLESGVDANAPSDRLRAVLSEVLVLCTRAELEKRARDLEGMWPDWVRECFRQAAAKGAN